MIYFTLGMLVGVLITIMMIFLADAALDRLFDDDRKCPPCNQDCNQGRDCPARRP